MKNEHSLKCHRAVRHNRWYVQENWMGLPHLLHQKFLNFKSYKNYLTVNNNIAL